jgi:hypothetical protein
MLELQQTLGTDEVVSFLIVAAIVGLLVGIIRGAVTEGIVKVWFF